MTSIRALVAVTVAALLLNTTTPLAAANDVQDGTYVCITDRTAGIQGDSDKRYAGSIQPTPEYEKFFVAIRRIKEGSGWQTDDKWQTHNSAVCSSEAQGKNLQRDWETGDYVSAWFEERCLATTELHIDAGGGSPYPYFSSFVNIFTNIWSERFQIFGNLHFIWNRSEDGNSYVSEGRCSLIK